MSRAAASVERTLELVSRTWGALRWPVGMAIATYRVTRRIDVERHVESRRGLDPGPADRPVPGDQDDVQPRAQGAGDSSRRRYRLRVRETDMSPERLISTLALDPNLASPFEVARFVKTSGRLGELVTGDEYLVWMPGPWNGPVRVADRTPTSFRLATLRGHMEAGEIEFRARREGGELVIEIESAARSGSLPSWLLYGPLRVGQEIQLHMWVHFLERTGHLSGGVPAGPVEVSTIRFPDDRGEPSRRASRRAMRALDALHARAPNFTAQALEAHDPHEGWRVDDYRVALPPEAPGSPERRGAWVIAVELAGDYEFADPALIHAVYYPGRAFEGRDMLLEGRFLGLRFLLGVRVVATIDEQTTLEGRPARVWGWSYATLEGHLEMGRMDYLVVKFTDSGEVEFRMHAVSRVARIRNPLVRFGFGVFGRGLQRRFARTAAERMRRLVEERRGGVSDLTAPSTQSIAVQRLPPTA